MGCWYWYMLIGGEGAGWKYSPKIKDACIAAPTTIPIATGNRTEFLFFTIGLLSKDRSKWPGGGEGGKPLPAVPDWLGQAD